MQREEVQWIRAGLNTVEPIWGFRNGMQIGLWPMDIEGRENGGPRGLFRAGYPIKDDGRSPGLVNFIAIEPVVNGRRGFSELEPSIQDGRPGKLFWSGLSDQSDASLDPGYLERTRDRERLSVTIYIEPFNNGAKPVIELTFSSDRPGEVQFTLNAAPGSAPMESCILTATMGNYMRLRRLHLSTKVINSKNLWPDYRDNEFTPDALFPGGLIPLNKAGDMLACATTDEMDPHAVPADPRAPGWHYRGTFPVTQYWRKPAGTWSEDIRLRVNGRRVYWASEVPIPNGLSYENFELVEPFSPGQIQIFGLNRSTPRAMTV